jgi:putative peptidoglycan lipid II flippase
MTPLCPIVALLWFRSIEALAVGTVAGALLHAVCLGWGLRRHGVPLAPRWPRLTPPERQVLAAALPMLVGSLINSANPIVDQTMASMLGSGSVAGLEYGKRLTSLVVGIASMALGAAVLPRFSAMVVERDFAAIRHTLRTYTRLLAAVSVAGILVILPLSLPIVRLLLQRGAFTDADALMVSRVQICYFVQAPFFLVGILGVRLLSALGHNRTLVWISSLNVLTNLAGNWALMRVIGLPGIALSSACVYACSMLVILHCVRRKLPCA